MTLPAALVWAYRDELPKASAGDGGRICPAGMQARSAWSSIERYGRLHAMIDAPGNQWGLISSGGDDEPDADAVAIGRAVEALSGSVIGVPDGWNPAPELDSEPDLRDAAINAAVDGLTSSVSGDDRVFRLSPQAAVWRLALLGALPQWRMTEAPKADYVRDASGRVAWFVRRPVSVVVGENADGTERVATIDREVKGTNARGVPFGDAYRKRAFTPDPVSVIAARAEWQVLRLGLMALADDLWSPGRLSRIALEPFAMPACPWEGRAAM